MKKRIETAGESLPPNNQSSILALKPSKTPLLLKPWHGHLNWPTKRFLSSSLPLCDLTPYSPFAEFFSEPSGIIAFIGSNHLKAFFGSSHRSSPNFNSVNEGEYVLTFISIGRGCATTDRHSIAIRDQMNQNPFALMPIVNALTATLSRGKKSRLWPHNPTESVPFLGQD
jgi:hypothetical protein